MIRSQVAGGSSSLLYEAGAARRAGRELARAIVSAFHSPEDGVILEALFASLVAQQRNGPTSATTGMGAVGVDAAVAHHRGWVGDAELSEKLNLSAKFVRQTLQQLRRRGIITGSTQKGDAKKSTIFNWGFNHERLALVVKYRIMHMHQQFDASTQLEPGSSEEFVCSNPDCFARTQCISMYQAMEQMQRQNLKEFACEYCQWELIAVDQSSTADASSTDSSIRMRFNACMQPIFARLASLVKLIEQEKQEHEERERDQAKQEAEENDPDNPRQNIQRRLDALRSAAALAAKTGVQVAIQTGGKTQQKIFKAKRDAEKKIVACAPADEHVANDRPAHTPWEERERIKLKSRKRLLYDSDLIEDDSLMEPIDSMESQSVSAPVPSPAIESKEVDPSDEAKEFRELYESALMLEQTAAGKELHTETYENAIDSSTQFHPNGYVLVAGQRISFNALCDAHFDAMSSEEYQDYARIAQQLYNESDPALYG